MKVDAEIAAAPPSAVGGLARAAEETGFDCLWVNETKHDPFVQLALAAQSTSHIKLGTSIALAFTRSPTTLAQASWDIQWLSGGRLILGLGSQVKGHIERRFGLKWESPAPKMKETVLALRAVWGSWQGEGSLDFRGRFYSLSLMTPFFSPGPIEHPRIPVYIAAVNPGMCRVAGSVAEGVHVHPLHTMKYLKEVMIPAVSKGATAAGRKREEVAVAASVFAAVGDNAAETAGVKEAYRGQIAFYASTRTYRKLMDLHGWGDICDRLHALSVKAEWGKMASEVGDDVLGHFVVEGTWEEIGRKLEERYAGAVDRVRLYVPFDGGSGWRKLVKGVRAGR